MGRQADPEAAFRALAAEGRGRLVAVAERVLRDRHEAEDVVQDTLAAVWERLPHLAPVNMRAYVFRAVELNALKRRARRVREARLGRAAIKVEDVAAAPEAPEAPHWGIDPLALEDALAGLPEEQRIVLRMKYYLGLTFREIAATLRISANTAASRARYALNVLRRALRGAPPSGPDQ